MASRKDGRAGGQGRQQKAKADKQPNSSAPQSTKAIITSVASGGRSDGAPAGTPAKRREEMGLDELWADLRQGARNVAGVTWQVAVSVHLLVMARCGHLPFSAVTPEGVEDLDCEHVDGTKTFVQMKEVAAGDGQLVARRRSSTR